VPVQQLFYRTVVPVSVERHREWSLKTGDSYAYAAGVNSVPLTAIEFAQATAEYPVVFTGTDKGVFPAAILGLRGDENLFLSADGGWRARYVPAFVRRYPFVFSQDEAGTTFTLNLDETFEGFNQTGRGERLFDAEGEQTQFLRGVLGFLQDYQAHFLRTRAFCDRLIERKLLQPMQAQFTLGGGEQRSLTGFMAVDREKLKALPQEVAAEMLARDELECVYLHLASLRHFQDMLERAQAAAAAAVPTAEATPPGPTGEP
jgi:hypothetical protein